MAAACYDPLMTFLSPQNSTQNCSSRHYVSFLCFTPFPRDPHM